MKGTLSIIGGGILLIVLTAWIGITAINVKEQQECRTWANEAVKFSGFYLTSWQKAQCAHWKIEMNAPIK